MPSIRLGSTSVIPISTYGCDGPDNDSSGVSETSLPADAPVSNVGASIEQLAILLTGADEQDRTSARNVEQAADHAAAADDNARVQQMFDKASDDAHAALIKGLGTIAGGMSQLGSAFALSSTDASNGHMFDWRTALQSGKDVAEGLGTSASAIPQLDSERADANAAKLEAQSQAEIRSHDNAHDDEQASNESIQKVYELLNTVQQAESAAALAAASYRA
jgi:hypothetical protein